MISALCRKGNLLEATLRRGTGVQQVRQTNEKRLSSIIREMSEGRDHVCTEITEREFGRRAKCKDWIYL